MVSLSTCHNTVSVCYLTFALGHKGICVVDEDPQRVPGHTTLQPGRALLLPVTWRRMGKHTPPSHSTAMPAGS